MFAGQSALTLSAVTRPHPPAWLRLIVAAGACVLIAIAVSRVRDTLTSPHFEGYNLLLAAMLVVQGGLTLAACGRQRTRGVRLPAFASLRRGAP